MAEPARSDRRAASEIDALPRVAARGAPSPADLPVLASAGVPLVLKGMFDHWPALAAGRQSPAALSAYLAGMDRGAPVPVMEAPARSNGRFTYAADLREFNFTRRSAPLADTLARIVRNIGAPAAPFVAVQMLTLDTHLPDFVRQNPMPLLPSEVAPRLWIGGPVKTQIHNDVDHNLACVIAGRRRFVLFPPDQAANLYIGPRDNPPPLSLADPEAPDYDRFPRFRAAMAAARVAWLDPGDAILMPRHWWHHVTSLDPFNAMVNYWWGDPAAVEQANAAFLAALLALRDLPASERGYWQAMFEAHVFGEGDGAAHIPMPLRGALGPISPGLRATLRRQLLAAFQERNA